MVPQISWLSGTSTRIRSVPMEESGRGRLRLSIVAAALFACSSHSLARDELGGAVPRLPQGSEVSPRDSAQSPTNHAERDNVVSPRIDASQRDWPSLFHSLLASPGRTELAADVGKALQQNDFDGARQRLSLAVNAGTLAILIGDDIHNPELQSLLLAVAREQHDSQLTARIQAGEVTSNAMNGKGPGDTAEKERVRAEAAVQELRTVREQLEALKEKEARAVELEQSLEQERGRTASAAQDLNLMRGQLTAMAQNAISASDARDAYAREAERNKAALVELAAKLTAAQEQLAALEGSAAEATELRLALAREREAAKASAGEIDSLRRELVSRETERAGSAGAGDSTHIGREPASVTPEHSRVGQGEPADLRASEAKLQNELNQERERSASVVQQLSASQREILALKAQVAGIAAIKEALRQEKENTATALRDREALEEQVKAFDMYTAFIPGTLIFQTTPILLEPVIQTFRSGVRSSNRTGIDGASPQPRDRQVSSPLNVETERKLPDDVTMRIHRDPPQKTSQKPVVPPTGKPNSDDVASRDAPVKLKRGPPLPGNRNSAPPGPFAPDLPVTLRPVDGLWALY